MDPKRNTGLYKGVLDRNKVRAFMLHFDTGMISDPFLRIVGKHIKSLEAQIAELSKPKPAPKKKENDTDAS
tara:strand:+ start:1663 stop:1875 length:213 start_codon:yes stop_codon:yes gene_type:complete